MLLLLVGHIGPAFSQQTLTTPAWRRIPGEWPDTTNQVRAMIVSKGELYIGVAGTVAKSAQVWKLAKSGWEKHAEIESLKVAVLQTDRAGNLYIGSGTPHSAELPGKGHAEVWKVDANGKTRRLRAFRNKDIAYSMVWHRGKLHVGTMTEDRPGTGINGWPTENSYAAVYEMWVHDGALIAGTFCRTVGDGDVLKLVDNRWVNLDAPATIIPLSFETYGGKLVAALSNANDRHPNPIYTLQADGKWQPLGKAPTEWKNAYIPNHMVVNGTELYLGVGGARGTVSVWKYDGATWSKLAGDGLYNSWVDPLVNQGAEWVYRLTFHCGKLYAGLASDRAPFPAQVWELTP
jgi:hypothetical protein